jgi:hypothetical protein
MNTKSVGHDYTDLYRHGRRHAECMFGRFASKRPTAL